MHFSLGLAFALSMETGDSVTKMNQNEPDQTVYLAVLSWFQCTAVIFFTRS